MPPSRTIRAFWHAIEKNGFAPPSGVSPTDLVQELSRDLASPDPELRDYIAYSTLATWIYRKRFIPADALRSLRTQWIENLRTGVGEKDTDSVLLRSFSALSLSTLVALDNEAPFLQQHEFGDILSAALTYLRDERDLRGFDPREGWIHSTAHTADLLKFLGRSRHLERSDQVRILDAITRKLRDADDPFTHGEDERLARAVLSIAARADLDPIAFREWVSRSTTPPVPTPSTTPANIRAAQNVRHLFTSLHALLSLEAREGDSIGSARRSVVEGLRRLL